jgi:hypothetical protein
MLHESKIFLNVKKIYSSLKQFGGIVIKWENSCFELFFHQDKFFDKYITCLS